ncbi:MAG: PH domain-containing protein [Clostridia bacterium]|nr:PH domain-containing protein [Clostridia bacterium]
MNIDENFFKDDGNVNGNFSIREMVENKGEEKVLWDGKPDKKSYVLARVVKMLPIVLIWLAFDGFAIYMVATQMDGLPTFVYFILIGFFIVHLTPVWIWIANIISAFKRLKNTEYAFTDKRVVIKTGFFAKFDNIYYSDIASVNLHVGVIDKMFKVGDIIIRTTAGDTYMVEDVSNPYFIEERLQKIVLDIKTDMQFPNDMRPDTNHGYNTHYEG